MIDSKGDLNKDLYFFEGLMKQSNLIELNIDLRCEKELDLEIIGDIFNFHLKLKKIQIKLNGNFISAEKIKSMLENKKNLKELEYFNL